MVAEFVVAVFPAIAFLSLICIVIGVVEHFQSKE